jgi:hypothetical protein
MGFRICDNKGFHITFENGWTISVQFGGGNYCANYDFPIGTEHDGRGMASIDAEVAYWGPDGGMQKFKGSSDRVAGRWTPAQVLKLMNRIAKKKCLTHSTPG